jgi:tRNA pseudouridine(55) synthase
MPTQGILPIDKPLGLRSFYCVEKVKKIIGRSVKVGHGGTLDSSASGLVVLLLGGATRLSGLIMLMPKVYAAGIKLGAETTTCDYTGERTREGDFSHVRERDVDEALVSFLGWRMQTPPKVSAVHVGGRRAHEAFRAGDDPEMTPRPVFIESISRRGPISGDGEFSLSIRCGKGAYIRAIARDIGRILGCGAYISNLSRESIGFLSREDALSPGLDFSISPDELLAKTRSLDEMGKFLPCYDVDPTGAARLSNGLEAPFASARRSSLGENCPEDTVLARSRSLYSIARVLIRHGRSYMAPEVNILR